MFHYNELTKLFSHSLKDRFLKRNLSYVQNPKRKSSRNALNKKKFSLDDLFERREKEESSLATRFLIIRLIDLFKFNVN